MTQSATPHPAGRLRAQDRARSGPDIAGRVRRDEAPHAVRVPLPRPLRQAVVLPAGGSFDGLLAFRGEARVEGRLTGSVVAEGRLEVADGACVEGRIDVDEAIVLGRVRGAIRARRRVVVGPGEEVEADVSSPRIEVREGGRIHGRCKVGVRRQPVAVGHAAPDEDAAKGPAEPLVDA